MSTYDIVLTKSGTDYSYMLKQAGETKDWLITDAPLLPQTLITESASPSSIQPEREIQISQVDWRKGIQDFTLEDEHKYYESENCDARFKGEVILAPKKLSALSMPTTGNKQINDYGFEAWDDDDTLTFWTRSGSASTLDKTTDEYSGSYAARLKGYESVASIYQDLPFTSADKGRTFTFTAYCKRVGGTGTNLYLQIYDGVGTTPSSSITASDYTQYSVSRTLDANATCLRIQAYIGNYGLNSFYLYVDEAEVTSTTASLGSCSDIIEFGDDLVFASGPSLIKLSAGSLAIVKEFKTITDLCVFENRLYIAQGWSDEYFYTSDLSTFTECTLSNSTAKYMSNVGGGQFWISDTNSTMRDSDNPINGGTALSTPYQVGSDDYDITGLVDHDSIVFVRKEDDVYYLSVSDVLSLLDLKAEASTTYTYGLHLWGDKLYIPSGVNSLYEYDISAGTATVISPVRYAPGDANYDEEVLAICHDETYLYVVVDNGSDLKILAGRWETVDGDTDWVWHPLYDKTSNDITCMLISSATGDKRLYAGTDTSSDGIYPFIVPVGYSAVYLESGFECEASGNFITPWYQSNFPTENKYWKSVDITSKCCTDKTSITPYYQVKGGDWTAMVALTTSAYDGGYPDETTDSRSIGVSSERIRFKFAMAAADDDYTPILYGEGGGLVVYSVLESDKKRQIVATIRLAPQLRLRDDTTEERTISTDLTNLRGLYQGGGEITCTGPDETAYTVVFARDGYQEQLAYDEGTRVENWWCSVRLLEV